MKLLLPFVLWLLAIPALAADGLPTEAEVQARLCAGMQQEVTLGKFGRADCVSGSHAIEIDWSENWKEGVGQALAYSGALGLRPGLVLVCRQDVGLCLRHSLGAQETFGAAGISATVWECLPQDDTLAACRQLDIDP